MKVFNKNGNEIDLLTSTEVASIGNLIVPKTIGGGSASSLSSTGIYVLQENKVSDVPVGSNGILLVFSPSGNVNGYIVQIYVHYEGSTWIRTHWGQWYQWKQLN